jgi:hypothetical protein
LNNKRLAEIIKDPGIATEKEVKQIHIYSEEYSYSPFLKVLQARLDHLHDVKDKARSLTKAAIYIADRSILKDFITKDKLSITSLEDGPTPAKTKNEKKADKSILVGDKKDKTKDKEKVKRDESEALPEEVITEPARKEEKDVAAVKDKEDVKDAETVKNKVEALNAKAETIEDKSSVADIESREKSEGKLARKLEDKSEEKQEASREEQEKQQGAVLGREQAKEKELITDKQENEHEPVRDEQEKEHEPVKTEQKIKQEEIKIGIDKKEKNTIEDPEQKDKSKSSSLSKEIMENISELKKHKASLLNLLNIGSSDKSSPGDSKQEKSLKKDKSKQKKDHKDKKKDSSDQAIMSEEVDLKAQTTDIPENKNYPDYEEEDPVVIKDFLTRLEESNPPPKKKLKKEEQEKLIEKFIQSDPQENLASIMIKQGKHETAIDIYKKLIWKFPQKKAYFATQIEELKKKLKK